MKKIFKSIQIAFLIFLFMTLVFMAIFPTFTIYPYHYPSHNITGAFFHLSDNCQFVFTLQHPSDGFGISNLYCPIR